MTTNETTTAVAETVESTGNQIIEVIEYLGEKMGIAIDWTSENIWPRIENLLTRVTQYKITTNAIGTIIGLIFLIVGIVCLSKVWSSYKSFSLTKEDNVYWSSAWYSDITMVGGITLAVGFVTLIVGIILIPCTVVPLLEWIFIPEIRLIDYVTNLIGRL